MSWDRVELSSSLEVPASSADTQEHTVPNGKRIMISKFNASTPASKNAIAKLVWDNGGAGEEILWSINGSDASPVTFERTGDGTKKIALILENAEAGALSMSGFVLIWEQV